MITLTKTMTLTSLAVIVAVLTGLWMASATQATSGAQPFEPGVSVETRLGAAELDLCQGQAWPHFSQGCQAWIAATSGTTTIDRHISVQVSDVDHGFSVVGKARPLEVAAR